MKEGRKERSEQASKQASKQACTANNIEKVHTGSNLGVSTAGYYAAGASVFPEYKSDS